MELHLNTIEASAYLDEFYNVRFTPGTMEVWRSLGKGPQYKKIGHKVYYTKSALDAFASDGIGRRPGKVRQGNN